MNLNKGCIEIGAAGGLLSKIKKMNLNKGCIEIPIPTSQFSLHTG